MKAVRILLPIGMGILLLLSVTGCVLSPPAVLCDDESVTVVDNRPQDLAVPCSAAIEDDWNTVAGFELYPPTGVDVSTNLIVANGTTRRQIVARLNGQPIQNLPIDFGLVVGINMLYRGRLFLTVVPALQVSATATPATIAPGQSTQLQAIVTGGTSGHQYSWTPASSLNNPTSATPLASPATTTIYTLTVTDTSPSQSATAMVTVNVGGALPPPAIISITPRSGISSGGTSVTIHGSGFQSPAQVFFGAAQANNVNVVDAATITASTPAGQAGSVGVRVVNPDSQAATLSNGFSYVPDLKITSIAAIPPVISPGLQSLIQVVAGAGFPPYTFQWRGDRGLSNYTVSNPTASPSKTTVYQVTVSDSAGDVTSGSVTVTIGGDALSACFTLPDVPIVHGTPTGFTAACSTGLDHPIVMFEWWFNWNPANPTPPDQAGEFLIGPAFTYAAAGSPTVRLRIRDDLGITDEITQVIQVH